MRLWLDGLSGVQEQRRQELSPLDAVAIRAEAVGIEIVEHSYITEECIQEI